MADPFNLEHGQFLPMAVLAAIVLAPLLLEHDYFVAARLLHDLGADRGVGHRRTADRAAFLAADCEHFAQGNLTADLARDSLDHDLIARADAILLAACLYYCEHRINSNLISYRTRSFGSTN